MSSCIVVHKELGIFAAMMNMNDGESPIMIFTIDHEFKMVVDKVSTFKNPIIATKFIHEMIPKEEMEDYMILVLKNDTKNPLYATYKEILDNGHQQWAGYMIDSLRYLSTAKH